MGYFFRFLAVSLIALSLTQFASADQILNRVDRQCIGQVYVSPTGSDALPAAQGTMGAIGTAGLVRCGLVVQQCTKTITSIYWRILTGVASSVTQAAIYDSTGATLLIASAIDAATASNTGHSTTGLSPVTLTAGTAYQACVSNSGTTSTYSGSNGSIVNFGATNAIWDGAVGSKAQFNADCSGSVTPYACCTGSTTGTCTGMPSSLGTMTAAGAASAAPLIIAQ